SHHWDQRRAVVGDLDLAAGRLSGVVQPITDSREVEITRSTLGQREARQKDERNADQQPDPAALRLQKSLQNYFRGKISAVRENARRRDEQQQRRDVHDNAAADHRSATASLRESLISGRCCPGTDKGLRRPALRNGPDSWTNA